MNPSIFKNMLDLQIDLNNRTFPNWASSQLDWDAAILAEVGEALESLNYKWWKSGKVDLENAKLEAVDILHFVMSKVMAERLSDSVNTQDIANNMLHIYQSIQNDSPKNLNSIHCFKQVAKDALNNNSFEIIASLFKVFRSLDMDIALISKSYFTKNILNQYRQERGYNDPNSHYQKVVKGLEDNEIFFAIMGGIDTTALTPNEIKIASFTEMDLVVMANAR